MANVVGLDLNIDRDFLEESVRQTVIAGIAESLNGKNEMVSQIVRMTLSTKVDKEGRINSYERENKYTLLEYYVKKLISEVASEEIQLLVSERKDEVRKLIRTELQKKVNTEKFVGAFIDTVSTAISSTWVPRIDVIFDKSKEY